MDVRFMQSQANPLTNQTAYIEANQIARFLSVCTPFSYASMHVFDNFDFMTLNISLIVPSFRACELIHLVFQIFFSLDCTAIGMFIVLTVFWSLYQFRQFDFDRTRLFCSKSNLSGVMIDLIQFYCTGGSCFVCGQWSHQTNCISKRQYTQDGRRTMKAIARR